MLLEEEKEAKKTSAPRVPDSIIENNWKDKRSAKYEDLT
jgi:hypothetical protein